MNGRLPSWIKNDPDFDHDIFNMIEWDDDDDEVYFSTLEDDEDEEWWQ